MNAIHAMNRTLVVGVSMAIIAASLNGHSQEKREGQPPALIAHWPLHGNTDDAVGLHHVIGGYDPKHIAAVWDAAHNALEGEQPELAIDILWPRLCMVNLKNAYRERTGTDERGQTRWQVRWCGGREGFASWPRVADELTRRDYRGVICLCAEYDDEDCVDELMRADLAFARSMLAPVPLDPSNDPIHSLSRYLSGDDGAQS